MTKDTIRVGDKIRFKSDKEQTAEVVEIKTATRWNGDRVTVYVVKAPPQGFQGEYLLKLPFAEINEDELF